MTRTRIWAVMWALFIAPLLLMSPSRADTDESPDINSQVLTLFQKAYGAYSDKRYLDVPPLLDQALAKAREVKDVAGEAMALFGQSEMYRKIGLSSQADQLNAEAIKVLHQGNNKKLTASTLRVVAGGYRQAGQPEKSLDFYQQSLSITQEIDDKAGTAATLFRLSQLYSSLSQVDKSLDLARQALAAYREAENPLGEIDTMQLIGSQLYTMGDYKQAIDNYQMALSIAQQHNDLRRKATATAKIANVYNNNGQEQKAMEILQQAVTDFEQAIKTQPAPDLQSSMQDKRVEGGLLQTLASGLRNTNEKQALEYYQQSADLFQQVGDRIGAAGLRYEMAVIYSRNEEYDLALKNAQGSLTVFREFKSKQREGRALRLIGDIYNRMGDKDKALQFTKQGMQLFREIGNVPYQANTLRTIAGLEEGKKQIDDAIRDREESLQLYEKVRASLGGLSNLKTGYLEQVMPIYQAHINLLLQTNKPERAFDWSEKTKARVLIDLMYSGKVDLSKGVSQADSDRERELQKLAALLNEQIVAEMASTSNDEVHLVALHKKLTRADDQLQTFTNKLYSKYPQLAQKRAAKTATLTDIGQFLPADTVLLSYLSTESKTILFSVTSADGKATAHAYTIAATPDELGETLSDFRSACADSKKAYKGKAHELYDLLIAPAAADIAGKTRLLICPDGMLWGLPFQVLMDKSANGRDEFLAERFEIDYAYSASSVQAALTRGAAAAANKATKTLLVMANPDFGGTERFTKQSVTDNSAEKRPISADSRALTADSRAISSDSRSISSDSRSLSADSRAISADSRGAAIIPLPGTQLEADALKTDFPDAQIYTGKQALETTAKSLMPDFRYLHFATHGVFNDTSPMLSSVVLAEPMPNSTEDGFLTAREIYDLNLKTDMVVLSACNTGTGKNRSGEGIIGLTWALFVAGAPTQVVSQWSVNDQSTATLMKNFYAQLKTGDAKGDALRQAELQLMHDGVHGHPFYWAPFVLMGDWGN